MSTREQVSELIDSFDEKQLNGILSLFADDNALALFESELIAKNPEKFKTYDSFDNIIAEIDAEIANEYNAV